MASLTLFYVMSVTLSASKHWLSMKSEPTEYPVSRPEPCASLISLHTNLNSMIQQYWIHHFFLWVKWAHEWRISHARARRCQQDAWSCWRASTMLMDWSSGAVKPSLVPSGVYYRFYFLKTYCLTSEHDFFFIWPSGKSSLNYLQSCKKFKKKQRCQRLDGKVSVGLPVQMVWLSCLLYVCNTE